MKPRERNLLLSIAAECRDVLRYADAVGERRFLVDDVYQKAIALSLLNIGERANALSREIWTEQPDIPWRRIVDLRNLVAHGYGEIRMELMWNLTRKEIPELLARLERLLEATSGTGSSV